MTARFTARIALVIAGVLAVASGLLAQCNGVNHVTWPAVNPVWDFCWVRPADSSAPNGSGLELTDVRYNGTLILARAHIPLLNVKYTPNVSSCGGANLCYRDWLYSEQDFQCAPCQDASGASASCTALSAVQCTGTTTPATTVCQHPGTDAGSFSGVAVEDFGTSLRLTSQCTAGWYRYIPVWEFFPDGTIQARFDATSIDATCVAYTHEHHAYWRLDFDVNGPAGNYVDEVLSGGGAQRVTLERNFIDTSPARSKWRIGSASSPYAVEVARNADDGGAGDANAAVPNDFPIADGWVLAYNASELDDGSNRVGGCGAGLNAYDGNQPVDGADIVLWVRAGALHQGEAGGMAQDCSMFGPTIKVISAGVSGAQRLNTVTPCRIVDTRNAPGPYGGPALPGNGIRDFALAGQCGIPGTAKSVAVNLTVVQPASDGYFTAFAAGGSLPLASMLNFLAGQTKANNAVLPLGTGGAVTIFNGGAGAAHVLIDVTGWFE
ncbi:MAG TPA: hypothetical protein VF958_10575 [Thermoanaerobaculia bacterium]